MNGSSSLLAAVDQPSKVVEYGRTVMHRRQSSRENDVPDGSSQCIDGKLALASSKDPSRQHQALTAV
jgi:hypothetical protein